MSHDKTIDFKADKQKQVKAEVFVPCLVVLTGPEKGAVFPLREGETFVGRSSEKAQIVLEEPGISRTHAKFTLTDGKVVVEDLGSTNGVFVNGDEVKQRELQAGDAIALSGETCLRMSLQDSQVSKLLKGLYRDALLDASGVLTQKSFRTRLKASSEASLAVVEIDHLERTRDRFGHSVEKDLIAQVAGALKDSVAEKGMVARLSGEGFAINLHCRALDADEVMEGVRKGIECSNFKVSTNKGPEFIRVTVSIGVAAFISVDDFDESLAAAEAALLMAKQMGRNRLHLSERKKFGK